MKLAIDLGFLDVQWEQHITYAVEAERLGVDFAWSPEAWGYDAVTPLAYLAAKTNRIRLGTSIMQIGARTPAMIAMTAMTMAALSNDRFILGLGVSGPQVMEGWHGVRFAHPLQRTRETIEIVRMITRGERLTYAGEIYQLPLPGGEGKSLVSSAQPRPNLPIYLATLGPKNLELTGELANGWLGTSFIPRSKNPPSRRKQKLKSRTAGNLQSISTREQNTFGRWGSTTQAISTSRRATTVRFFG